MRTIRADEVKVGDWLDLEGDPYADPPDSGDFQPWEFEYAVVTEIARDERDGVILGGEGWCVGFPAEHKLRLAE